MKRNGPIRLVIADDHRLFRDGLRALLRDAREVRVVGEARDGEEAVLVTRRECPDILLLDLHMPILDGIAVIRLLCKDPRRPRIVILSSDEEEAGVAAAMAAGADGYIAKRVDRQGLIDILKGTLAGNPPASPYLTNQLTAAPTTPPAGHNGGAVPEASPLSAKERDVLRLLAQGYSDPQIAANVYLSRDSVKAYLKRIFDKLQVDNRTQAAVLALKMGLIPATQATGEKTTRGPGPA